MKTILHLLYVIGFCSILQADDWVKHLVGEYSNAMPGRDFIYLRVDEAGIAVYSNR